MEYRITEKESQIKIWRSGDFSLKYHQPEKYQLTEYQKELFDISAFAPIEQQTSELMKKVRECRNAKPQFKLTRKSRLTFISRSIALFDKAEHNVTAQVLTFRAEAKIKPYEVLNRYLTNLRTNYDLKSYVSALELTANRQFHFHLMVDMPFQPVKKLNKAYASARNDYANNAITGVEKVRSRVMAVHYCAKYYAKGNKTKQHPLRKFSYSSDLVGTEFQYIPASKRIDMNVFYNIRQDYCEIGKMSLAELEKIAKFDA